MFQRFCSPMQKEKKQEEEAMDNLISYIQEGLEMAKETLAAWWYGSAPNQQQQNQTDGNKPSDTL